MSTSQALDLPEARVLGAPTTIVCAYAEGTLASAWFQAYQRLKRTVARAGVDAHVELTPITALPPKLDVLVVPPSLAHVAASFEGAIRCMVMSPDELHQKGAELIAGLPRAARVQPEEGSSTSVALHRGFQLLARSGTDRQ